MNGPWGPWRTFLAQLPLSSEMELWNRPTHSSSLVPCLTLNIRCTLLPLGDWDPSLGQVLTGTSPSYTVGYYCYTHNAVCQCQGLLIYVCQHNSFLSTHILYTQALTSVLNHVYVKNTHTHTPHISIMSKNL